VTGPCIAPYRSATTGHASKGAVMDRDEATRMQQEGVEGLERSVQEAREALDALLALPPEERDQYRPQLQEAVRELKSLVARTDDLLDEQR
jgi:acyl-CoA reductase-like NAD-dependent aldehyde dehydrogenase